ncbi:response regulator [Luteimonas terrae]|uniref:histidine kinase n=1 Tax=Luteimonas terrae TaxID=1530191 RepID=A0ABU1XV61_9GAMM|nr:response regulator [Luteimonas terrae]MDR7192036.1 PAS domain S-box-containing protein [Luteimonas terrae]
MRLLSGTTLHNLGFAAALVLLSLLAWQGKRAQDVLLDANNAVADSLELINVVQGMLSALQDVETGSRGYMLTADPEYLEPYRDGRERLSHLRALLGHMLAGPDRAEWLAELDASVARRVEIAAANMERRDQLGLEQAAAAMAGSGAKEAMDALRAQLGELDAEERLRLAADSALAEKVLEQGRLQAVGGSMIIGLLMIWFLVAMNRNLRRQAQLAQIARAGEARQNALLRAVPDELYELHADGRVDVLSQSEGSRAAAPPALCAVLAEHMTRHPDRNLIVLDWKDGHGHDHEVRIARAEGGESLAIVRNVTEAARARRRLRDQQAFLRSVVDADENLIFVRDAAGRVLLCNEAFADLLGMRPGQVEGQRVQDIVGGDLLAPLLDGDTALLRELPEFPELRRAQLAVNDASGRERWFQLLKRPMILSDGQRLVLAVAVDISTRRQVERMKSEFISTVSHELRTPLTAIRGGLSMVVGGMAGAVPETLRPLLDIAYKNSERLVRLINDILDIEKLESGRIAMHLQSVALRPLVAQSIEHIAGYAGEFQVRVRLQPGEDGDVEIDTDRFAQVMANLLSNAIKHSPPGEEVVVEVAKRERVMEVVVADRGAGIPEAFRARVFERFAQADSSDVRTRGGTGLGLAITRSLVEQLGGEIGFDTQTDHGTRFFVHLPLATRRALPPTGPEDRQRVLVLDGDTAAATQLAAMLDQRGYAAVVADSAAQARQVLAAMPVHALTINLALPDEDGLAFVYALRSQAAYRHLPVLALGVEPPSAERDAVVGGAVGLVDWLSKPLEPTRILDAVRACLGGADMPIHVLHVEDDADLRALVATLLAQERLTLHAAGSLVEARNALAQRHHDLVILDLMLPDGDGSELLAELAAASPPTLVIIFSALDADTTTPDADSGIVLRRLVKSRHSGATLAGVIGDYLRNWPPRTASQGDPLP